MIYPNPANSAGANVRVVALVDPWKIPYGYSTINVAQAQLQQTPPLSGFNSTFDLWSTCGETTGHPASPGSQKDPSLKWIKNW
jgi:hypothetical protein